MEGAIQLTTLPYIIIEEIVYQSAKNDIRTLIAMKQTNKLISELIHRKTVQVPTKRWGQIIEMQLTHMLLSKESFIPSKDDIYKSLEMASANIVSEAYFEKLTKKVTTKLAVTGDFPDVSTCTDAEEIKNTIMAARVLVEERSLQIAQIWLHNLDMSQIPDLDIKVVMNSVTTLGMQSDIKEWK